MTRRLALHLIIVASALLAACAQTPTAPSPTTAAYSLGSVAQQPPNVPNAIIPVPDRSLGATRFIAFGDSITCGVESIVFGNLADLQCPAGTVGYPERLLGMLRTYNPAQQSLFGVNKRGEPGERASEGERRLTAELTELAGAGVPPGQRPQVLLLLDGINDMIGGVSPVRAASSVAQLVQIARLFNLTVLVATMPQTYHTIEPNTGRVRDNAAAEIPTFNAEIRRLSAQNVYIVDLYAAFGSNRSLIGDDGLHPTPAGYDVMAQQFHAAIVQRFPVRGSLQ